MVKEKKIDVYVDSWCQVCSKFGRVILKLNQTGTIYIKDIRSLNSSSQEKVDIEKGESQIAIIGSSGKVYYGFDSLLQVSMHVKFKWLFMPILLILKFLNVGNYLYYELSIRRKIIPIHCSNDCLKIDNVRKL